VILGRLDHPAVRSVPAARPDLHTHTRARTCSGQRRQNPLTTQCLLPHSLGVAPVDLTTLDPAHSPVHHPVTPPAHLLKPAASSRPGGAPPPPSDALSRQLPAAVSVVSDVQRCRGSVSQSPDMELGYWVTGSMGHLGHPSHPGHRVIILTRCETRVFPVFEKMPKMQNVHLKCWSRI